MSMMDRFEMLNFSLCLGVFVVKMVSFTRMSI